MANNFDTLLLPPDYLKALSASIDKPAGLAFMGMRVIESPLARRTRKVPDRLQRSRTFPFSGYEIANKEVSEPVAIMFNTAALGFQWPMPPIFKRDLSAFQDGAVGIINVSVAACG